MKLVFVQLEAAKRWHNFMVEAESIPHAFGHLCDLGVPLEAYVGYRAAKPEDDYPLIKQEDVDRLALLGWTYHGEKVDLRPSVAMSIVDALRACGVADAGAVDKTVSWNNGQGRYVWQIGEDEFSKSAANAVIKTLCMLPQNAASAGAALALMRLVELAFAGRKG